MHMKFLTCIQLNSIPSITKWLRYDIRTAVNLSYKIYGENSTDSDEPPVILVHGLLGNKRHWRSIGKTMVNMTKRSVIAVDLRNHGDSPHVNSHKYKDLAEDLLQLLTKLTVDRASLVGHSMGGRACMYFALMEPQKVAGLLVVDISPVSTSPQFVEYFPKILTAMKEINFKEQKKLTVATKETRKQLKDIINDDETMNAVLTNIKMKSDHTLGWACNLDILMKHFNQIASFPSLKGKQYLGPALFIGGQLSEYIPADDLNGIREMFPRAVVTYVPKTGHNVHTNDPKTFLELAIAFIKTNE